MFRKYQPIISRFGILVGKGHTTSPSCLFSQVKEN